MAYGGRKLIIQGESHSVHDRVIVRFCENYCSIFNSGKKGIRFLTEFRDKKLLNDFC